MILKSVFSALLSSDNPFKIVDKTSIVTREQLIGRVKRIQTMLLANNVKKIGIVSGELTSNTIVVYLASMFSGIDVIFFSRKNPIMDIISKATRESCSILFADAAIINTALKNKNLVNYFVNIVNINNYSCKHEAKFIPLIKAETDLSSIVYRDYIQLEESFVDADHDVVISNISTTTISDLLSVPIKRNTTVNAYDIHPHVMHFAVLNSILVGSTLKLRNVTEKGNVVFIDGFELLNIAIEHKLNLMPVIEDTMYDSMKLQFNNYFAKYHLKKAFKGKIMLAFNAILIQDLLKKLNVGIITKKGFRPNKTKFVNYTIWELDIKKAVELAARFNLPIKDSVYLKWNDKGILLVSPNCNTGIKEYQEFQVLTTQFKELLNKQYQTLVTPYDRPVIIHTVGLMP